MLAGFGKRIDICRLLLPVLGIIVATILISCGKDNTNSTLDSILDLYDQYDLVHLGERHWNMTDYHFRIALIKYPRFAKTVNDIVIESGNYLYQGILDRYILELQDVAESDLQKVWRNTVVTTGVWDATIYKDFIHAVRKVNEGLPREERLRLIAAEPPIDWSNVNTADDWLSFLSQRSTHTPKVIKSEVIDKGRKAFIIYGGAHFFKSYDPFAACARNIRLNLETLSDKQIFSILPLSGDDDYSKRFQDTIGITDTPLFVNLKTSELSNLQGDLFFPWATSSLGEFTDGILFFGTTPDLEAEYDSEAADDSLYQVELERRRAIESEWR